MLRTLWFALELKFVLKIRKQCVGNLTDFFFITKQIKKPYDCTLFCWTQPAFFQLFIISITQTAHRGPS